MSESSTLDERTHTIIVLGGPCSGKTTLSKRLARTFNFTHFSVGDLLREEVNRPNSKTGKLINEIMAEGKIVPSSLSGPLINAAMTDTIEEMGNYNFIIDGFPRNLENWEGWNVYIGKKVKILFVLYIECSESIALDRCLNRNEGRVDDTEETFKKRWHNYEMETMPLINDFSAKLMVRKVDGTKTQDELFKEAEKLFTDSKNWRAPDRKVCHQ